ncbi:Potassium voltage-gated channel subfamily KQT; possible potassium channel, VIC family [hydrothermal vent metagenome]|uniref:BK channel n=1 Tax=hydrothermal vent metagenome TaxID=652676 RepID=A0A1W1BJM2_9ZZZZ
MKELLLSFALFFHRSHKYKAIKAFAKSLLYDANNPYKRYFDITIVFLVISSVIILIYEVKNPVPLWLDNYDIYVVSLIFAVEYFLRLWVHNDISEMIIKEYNDAKFLGSEFSFYAVLRKGVVEKLRYMITPSAIVDLLAILPAYRPLRILRVFILFRVFKLLRYTKSINQFVDVLVNKKFELLTLLFLLLFIVFTSGIAMYILEAEKNQSINTLFDGIYWAIVTISTVGYGDISPVTDVGRAISILIIVSGIAMISFVTSVIVSAFSERLNELKEDRIVEQMNKSKSFMIICGYGQMTKMFFRQKRKNIEHYVIMDTDIARVEAAKKDGYIAIHEDASSYKTLSRFDAKYCDITVLCLTSSDVENIYITLNAKSISHHIKVISRVNDPETVDKFRYAGADELLLPNLVANTMIYTAITQPTMYKAIHAILTGKSIANIDEIHVHDSHTIMGKKIEDLDFSKHKLLFIGIVRKDKFIFNPSKDMNIEAYDILLVMGRKISLEYFKKQHEGAIHVKK